MPLADALIGLALDPNVSTPGQYAEVLKAAMAWNVETIAAIRKKGFKFDF